MTQFCAEPGCGRLVTRGRCVWHTRDHRNQRPHYPGELWYDRARWKRLRLIVLRANPLCVACARLGWKVPATDVDHVVKHDGDPQRFWDIDNLQGLCHGCHARKTARGA